MVIEEERGLTFQACSSEDVQKGQHLDLFDTKRCLSRMRSDACKLDL